MSCKARPRNHTAATDYRKHDTRGKKKKDNSLLVLTEPKSQVHVFNLSEGIERKELSMQYCVRAKKCCENFPL